MANSFFLCLLQQAELEASIANHENEYLEGTPSGNIITGFDNYTKGTTSAAAQRRRTGLIDQNRVFTRSSISYNALNVGFPAKLPTYLPTYLPTPLPACLSTAPMLTMYVP